MGTSSSHTGNKDNKGLLPNDFENPLVQPSVSWQATKTGFSKYINGNGGSIGKTASNYIKASGGTETLIKSSRSGIKGAINISRLFSSIQQFGIERTFDDLGIQYLGKSVREVCSNLVNYIVDVSESKEDSVARKAAATAMSEVYQYIEKHEMDIKSLENLNREMVEQVLCIFVENYIWGRILNDLEYCLEKYSDDIDRTIKVEKEMKDYVSNKVRTTFKIKEVRNKIFGEKSLEMGIEELYRKCYSALEGM